MQFCRLVVTQCPVPNSHIVDQPRHPMRRRRTQYPSDRRVIHVECPFRLCLQRHVIQLAVHIHTALSLFLHKHNMMPLTVIRFSARLDVVHRWPTTLTNIKIHRPTSSSAVRAYVKKRIAVAGIGLREQPQVVLPVSVHFRPHGNGVRIVLVGRQLVRFIVHPAQQRLLLVREREGIADSAFNHILGTQVGQLHVVAIDQLRRFGTLNLIQRPIGNQTVPELCVQGIHANEEKRRPQQYSNISEVFHKVN